MPIYEYLCEDCKTKFEKLVLKPDREEVLCPSCGKNHLTQQVTSFQAPTKGRFKDTSRPPWAEHPHPEDYKPDHEH